MCHSSETQWKNLRREGQRANYHVRRLDWYYTFVPAVPGRHRRRVYMAFLLTRRSTNFNCRLKFRRMRTYRTCQLLPTVCVPSWTVIVPWHMNGKFTSLIYVRLSNDNYVSVQTRPIHMTVWLLEAWIPAVPRISSWLWQTGSVIAITGDPLI